MKNLQFETLNWFQKNQTLQNQYDESFSEERLFFFRAALISIGITCFTSLLVFVIQQQDVTMIAIMATISGTNLLLMLGSQKLKQKLQYFLAIIYICYVAAASIVGVYGQNEPKFLHGYSMGMLYSSVIQYCDPKIKIVFTLATPWIFLILFNDLHVQNLPFIGVNLSSCILMGIITFRFDNKLQSTFTLQRIINKQKEIFNQLTNQSICAVSYDERQGIFQLEFQNKIFESSHQCDIKEFLRKYSVQHEDDKEFRKKANQKYDTLEEFLFEEKKLQLDLYSNEQINLTIRNKFDDELIQVVVTKVFILKQIFIITIKSNIENIQLQRYEYKISQLKESIINLSSNTGKQLQQYYRNINTLSFGNFQRNQEIIEEQQINIVSILNKVKNYLIYFQNYNKDFFFQNISIETFYLTTITKALTQYFTKQSQKVRRSFVFPPYQFNDNLIMKLNQKLLTQISINVFHQVLNYSLIDSMIRFNVITDELRSATIQQKCTQKSYQSKLDYLNSQDITQPQVLQFSFIFTSKYQIDSFNSIFCQKRQDDYFNSHEQNISSSVNFAILNLIGPYNEIFVKSTFNQSQQIATNEVYFYVYLDQTKLDPSFIKHIKQDKNEFF